MRLLLVEDDKDLSDFVREGVAREGFVVNVVGSGEAALAEVRATDYEAIVLDVNLPNLDGISVLKELRSSGFKGAILVATCMGQEKDKLEGLYGGADDYLVKPFLISELVARIRTVLRRSLGTPAAGRGSVLKAGDLAMDLLKRKAMKGKKELRLTKTEFDLLECFLRRPGQVLSQNVLRQHVSGNAFDSQTNTIEVHINHLRSKLDNKTGPSHIRTVRGSGYALDVE